MNRPPNRSLVLSEAEELTKSYADITAWQANLTAAAVNSITAEDVQQIVAKQIEKAKAGDERALKFVMGTLLGGNRPIQITNNVTVDVETAAREERARRRNQPRLAHEA